MTPLDDPDATVSWFSTGYDRDLMELSVVERLRAAARGTMRTFDSVGRGVSSGARIVRAHPPDQSGTIRALPRRALTPRLLARRRCAPRRDSSGGRVRKVGKALYAIAAARPTPEPYRWDGDPSSASGSDILTLHFRDIGRSTRPLSAIVGCRPELGKTCGESAKVNLGPPRYIYDESGYRVSRSGTVGARLG